MFRHFEFLKNTFLPELLLQLLLLLANYCKTQRLFESPQPLKIIKRSSKSQRAWPGRNHEVCCFATKLHTVNFCVHCLIWSKLLTFHDLATLNTSALRYWLTIRVPPTGDCKCHAFTLLPIINWDSPPLASTYMLETLYVHRTCTDVQISLLDPNPKPYRKTAIAHFR